MLRYILLGLDTLYTFHGVNNYFVLNTTDAVFEVKALVHWCSYDIFLSWFLMVRVPHSHT